MSSTTFIDLANAPEPSDEALYSQYLDTKEKEILARLFRKYMTLVFGVSMKYLREKHTAQDATMEVFERLMQHQPSSTIKNFRAFLYVVTKNHCLMKQRGEKTISLEISEEVMESAMEMHPIDKEGHEGKEKALAKCLKELKELQKDCVELFYLKQKSYLDISKELKVTLNAVKSHIQNGKRNLKVRIFSLHKDTIGIIDYSCNRFYEIYRKS